VCARLILQFGRQDGSITPVGFELARQELPAAPIHLYDAGHGFNCELRANHDPASAALAWTRTLDFLADSLK
ncbi:dienelactone hydrolase family protein, partial [Lysobacter sp. 2RAB21]